MLYRGLRQRGIYMPQPGWAKFCAKLAAALVVLGLAVWFAVGADAVWLTYPGTERTIRLLVLVIGGILVYFATLFALGFRVKDFRRRGTS